VTREPAILPQALLKLSAQFFKLLCVRYWQVVLMRFHLGSIAPDHALCSIIADANAEADRQSR
jgi:hypothetical protein